MKKLILFWLATTYFLFAIFSTVTYAASPNIAGNWNVTFFLEPSRSTGASQCIVFKLVPGLVAGAANSGTWTSPTAPGWSGQWIQLGDYVRWFGMIGTLATTESGNMENNNLFGGVAFNHYTTPTIATSSAGSFNAVRVSACSTTEVSYSVSDPATDPAHVR